MADSAAATVNNKRSNSCQIRSSKYTENIRKFKFTANNISSMDISIIIMFFLLRNMPQIPNKNKIMETVRYLTKSIG